MGGTGVGSCTTVYTTAKTVMNLWTHQNERSEDHDRQQRHQKGEL